MLLLHALILYLPSWCGGRKIFTGTAESLSAADVSVSIQTCFFFHQSYIIGNTLYTKGIQKNNFPYARKTFKKCNKID